MHTVKFKLTRAKKLTKAALTLIQSAVDSDVHYDNNDEEQEVNSEGEPENINDEEHSNNYYLSQLF